MDDRKYWVGFNLIKGIGAVRMQGLVAYFGDMQTAWDADAVSLAEAGLGAKVIERVLSARETVDLDQVWQKIESQGIKILTWGDEGYPGRLKEIDQPPPVLYVRGDYLQDDLFAVAIVGTRKVTSYGRQVTEEIASFLAASGITVISGPLYRKTSSRPRKSAYVCGFSHSWKTPPRSFFVAISATLIL